MCQPGWEGDLGENEYTCMCGWVTLLFIWNYPVLLIGYNPIQNAFGIKNIKIKKKTLQLTLLTVKILFFDILCYHSINYNLESQFYNWNAKAQKEEYAEKNTEKFLLVFYLFWFRIQISNKIKFFDIVDY